MRIRGSLLALIGMLMVCLPLFAVEDTPFSVGIFAFQEDSASFAQLVEEAGAVYANQFLVPNAAYSARLEEKFHSSDTLSTLQSISSAYASKSEEALERALEVSSEPVSNIADRMDITYKQIPYHQGYANLVENFPASRFWYASKGKFDALILLKMTSIASNDRIRLYWYDRISDTTTLLFDQVVVQNDTLGLLEVLGASLLSATAGPDYGLVIFDTYNPSIPLEVDGLPLSLNGKQELFPSGNYTVSLSEEGYVSKQIQLEVRANTIIHIPSSLDRLKAGSMHFSSSLGKVNWFVDGVFLDFKEDLRISSSLVPLVVVAQKEGFASKSLQVQKPVQEIEVFLQPEWMTHSVMLQEEQEGFYKSLRNTMLFFGLYVASTTLSQTFEVANPLWQPLQVATSGIALVSTLQTIMNLASYASLAGSGVR